MFRKILFALLIAAVAVSASPSVSSAADLPKGPKENRPKRDKPWKWFRVYSMTGATLSYTGYLYAQYSRQIALTNGYDDGETQGSFYYGEVYAYYGFIYGYYGYEYGYKDWITMGGDMAVAARNYEQGIYDYLYNGYYQSYQKQLQPIMDALSGAVAYEDLSQKYYYYAVTFMEPKQNTNK